MGPLVELIIENGTDVLTLAECQSLDCQALINSLYSFGQNWKLIEICARGDTKVLAKQSICIMPHAEEKHYSVYKINSDTDLQLLIILHLPSAMHLEECARNRIAENISRILQKIEEELFASKTFKSIIVGDFNLQPYSEGVAGVDGFNATKSMTKALQNTRLVDGENKYFYFNPVWKLMGENKLVQGTYYNSSDSQRKSIYWYSFDEVLIRPYFIKSFNWNYFDIIEKTTSHNFVPNTTIDKEKYSDHLPLKFEIVEV